MIWWFLLHSILAAPINRQVSDEIKFRVGGSNGAVSTLSMHTTVMPCPPCSIIQLGASVVLCMLPAVWQLVTGLCDTYYIQQRAGYHLVTPISPTITRTVTYFTAQGTNESERSSQHSRRLLTRIMNRLGTSYKPASSR